MILSAPLAAPGPGSDDSIVKFYLLWSLPYLLRSYHLESEGTKSHPSVDLRCQTSPEGMVCALYPAVY